MKIWFDMDGTIADLYGVENWLEMLIVHDETPYAIAKPIVNLSVAKIKWLANHLKSVHFDEIRFVPYWYTKNDVNTGADVLFDDEERHLEKWTGTAVHASKMIETLKAIA